MDTKVEANHVGIEEAASPPSLLAKFTQALVDGSASLVASLRTAIVTLAIAKNEHKKELAAAREEATTFVEFLKDPDDDEKVEKAALISLAPKEPPPSYSVPEGTAETAPALFRVHGRSGALLSIGSAALLAGEGGAGKSTLATELVLSVIEHGFGGNGVDNSPKSPLVICRGGPVLWLNYEEDEGLLNQRFLQRAKARGIPEAALRRLHIRNMAGDEHGQWPLFGPPNRGKQSGLYNSRPERLPGWDALVKSLEHIARVEGEYPTLIVIDPALSAFVGDPNSVGPVREFTGALGALAKSRRCGILLLAHATKEGSISPFDRRQVGGSGAWTDGLRCAMTITHGEGSGVPGTLVRSFAVLKANSGPNLWTTVKPIFANGTSGRMIGFERRQPFEWYAKDLWLSDADERKKHRNERRQKAAKPNGAGPRANGGEPDSSAPSGQSSTGNGSKPSTWSEPTP